MILIQVVGIEYGIPVKGKNSQKLPGEKVSGKTEGHDSAIDTCGNLIILSISIVDIFVQDVDDVVELVWLKLI